LAPQQLGDRALAAASAPGVVEPGRMPQHEARGMNLGVELGEQMGDRLELADLLSELLALLSVCERLFERGGGDAERVRAELEVFDIEDRHQLTPARSHRRRAAENVV